MGNEAVRNEAGGTKGMAGRLAVLVLAAGLLAGCVGSSAPGTAAGDTSGEQARTGTAQGSRTGQGNGPDREEGASRQVTILVAAAASLKNVLDQKLIPMFEEQNPGVRVEGTYDSSGKLQTQIEEGLEADVFLSAAMKQMDALDQEGLLVPGTRVSLLENRIVLIVPAGGEVGFREFGDIAYAESIVLGDPASVPAGQYAREALETMGIWDRIQDRVSLGTSVTEVLNQVAAGSGDAGIVYATDAAGMGDQVTVVAEAPEGCLKEAVLYPAALVKGTAREGEARAFLEFLQSEEAARVFGEYGFSVTDRQQE